MKNNGNNFNISDYYLGLDVGTNSVGWAVTNNEYAVSKFKGNAMWGVRLFDEALDASSRRTARTSRHRQERRRQRLDLLELLFNDDIRHIDKLFFVRLKESSLFLDDKSQSTGKYTLFNDDNFTDKDYLKKYPTIYHLRSELVHSTEPHDIRFVYLALHHIIKNRGHFLFDGEASSNDISSVINDLLEYISDEYDTDVIFSDQAAFESTLQMTDITVTAKKKLLRGYISANECSFINPSSIADILSGATVKLCDLFNDDELKNAEIKSVTLKSDIDAVFDALSSVLGERVELLLQLKKLFDIARLSQILGGNEFISDAKINLYERNYADLRNLKKFVKDHCPEKYNHIFNEKKEKLNNYAAYSGYKTKSGEYTCSQEDFCKFLDSELSKLLKDNEVYRAMAEEIAGKTFLTKLRGTDNGVIPQQLNRAELCTILDNASSYLPLLNRIDNDGLTIKQKIISIFDFKVPYYVGPLNQKSHNGWVIRSEEKIYPWNFETVVDVEKSAQAFITKLIGRCTYTGEYVLPQDSLLYSEYMVLNEINLIKINGNPIPVSVKKELFNDLFVENCKKVTKKGVKVYLLSKGYITVQDEISGIDDTVKGKLKSLHDFRRILNKTGNIDMVEDIIKSILVFGDDKKMLRKWIKREYHELDDNDISYICRLRYKGWGRLSKEFLTQIYSPDENGEPVSVITALRETTNNLMQLLSSNFLYSKAAEEFRQEKFGGEKSLSDRLDEMYISPSVRRSLRQTLKLVDEIVDAKKAAPKKIFIEVARGSKEEMKNKRTQSRKDKLIELYKACKEDSGELFGRLCDEPEDRLRRDKLFLYYSQFGKCMYSGESIDISALLQDDTHYDIDHIFPRSRVKDNSIDNRVLVKSELNRDKTNIYPIQSDIRQKMYPFWKMLREKNLISEKKFIRLTRNSPLTEKELSDFVARQVVETQQSTKALATLMGDYYPNTRIVYSKAGNVSDFRQEFGIIKCRDVNDLHHAKDAYLNIVVGNVYCTKFTDKFFNNISNEKYSLNKVFEFDTKGAWKADGSSIATVKKYLSKNNILYTRMPHEVRGQLFDLQIVPAGKGQLPKKQGLDIAKYGGYNKLSGAYFCIVEHTLKKKRVRTIEPVFIYKKSLYESSPTAYCTDILGLVDPIVIAPTIRIDALLEINGTRLNICGRQNNQIIYKHAHQLYIDAEHEAYIKKISKYIDICSAQKKDVPLSEYDGITMDMNVALYEWMKTKLAFPTYYNLFKNVAADMDESKTQFSSLHIADQCRILLEVLKAFKCDRQNPNFEMLNGKKSVGIVVLSKTISNAQSAFLIHQSVTGLYEYKTDLLR